MAKNNNTALLVAGVLGVGGIAFFAGRGRQEPAPASGKMVPGGFVPIAKTVKKKAAKKRPPTAKPPAIKRTPAAPPKPLTKKQVKQQKKANNQKARQARKVARNSPEARAQRTAKTLAILDTVTNLTNTAAATATSFKK